MSYHSVSQEFRGLAHDRRSAADRGGVDPWAELSLFAAQKNEVRLALVIIFRISSVWRSSHALSFSAQTAGIDVKRPLRIVAARSRSDLMKPIAWTCEKRILTSAAKLHEIGVAQCVAAVHSVAV
jgi:hypothetical protein